MVYYTPDMFDINQIDKFNKEIIMQKEALEFRLSKFQEQFDGFKKSQYESLLIFERKKKQNPDLMPDLLVLRQMKEIEQDAAVKEFREEIARLEKEIKLIDSELEKKKNKLKNMFQFKALNLEIYYKEFQQYYKSNGSFEELMKLIFNNEFLDKNLYELVNWQRQYDVLYLLQLNAPEMWKTFFRILLAEQKALNIKYDYEYIQNRIPSEIITDAEDLANHHRVKLAELTGEMEKIDLSKLMPKYEEIVVENNGE